MTSKICASTAACAVLVACAAAPSTSGAQPVPRKAQYTGETRPGAGVVQVSVSKRRVVNVQIDYRFWRCSGPGPTRQAMGWDLEVFSPEALASACVGTDASRTGTAAVPGGHSPASLSPDGSRRRVAAWPAHSDGTSAVSRGAVPSSAAHP
jgi:hypothetical protein